METCTLNGLFRQYTYVVADLAAPWNEIGGCYAFTRKVDNTHYILRVGKCANFKTRPMPPGHDCWNDAVTKHGATHLLVRAVSSEAERVSEERDLIAAYNPPMNEHHRTGLTGLPAAPLGLFGGGLINSDECLCVRFDHSPQALSKRGRNAHDNAPFFG